MSENDYPTETPNVALANPAVRRAIGWVTGIGAIVLPTLTAIDAASEQLDWTSWTAPANAGLLALVGVYGLSVTQRNIPRD